MRDLLVGAAGSALVLAIDFGITHWGNDNIVLRIGLAILAFAAFFVASFFVSKGDANDTVKRILSGIKSKRSVDIDSNDIKSPQASEILSNIEAEKDIKIKVGKIDS